MLHFLIILRNKINVANIESNYLLCTRIMEDNSLITIIALFCRKKFIIFIACFKRHTIQICKVRCLNIICDYLLCTRIKQNYSLVTDLFY